MNARLRRRGGLLLIPAVLCLITALLLPPGAAAAQGGDVQVSLNGAAFTARPDGPLLDVGGLVPGTSTSADLGVRNAMDDPAALDLRLLAVHDDDNGCTAPEARVDRSCGTGNGELGASLVFTVEAATTKDGTYTRMWSGTAAELERGVDPKLAVPADGDRWLRVTAALPASVGSIVQSDSFGFKARVELSTTRGTAGVTVGPHRPSSGTGAVALTGVSVGLFVVGAALMLIAGAMMVAGGWRRP